MKHRGFIQSVEDGMVQSTWSRFLLRVRNIFNIGGKFSADQQSAMPSFTAGFTQKVDPHRGLTSGFITLVAVVIATVVAVAVVISIFGTGISSGKIGEGSAGAAYARSYANACAELALEEIREDGAGTVGAGDDIGSGNVIFTIDDGAVGECSFTITDIGGENRTIQAIGEAGNFTRLVEVDVDDIDTTISIESWQEVASF